MPELYIIDNKSQDCNIDYWSLTPLPVLTPRKYLYGPQLYIFTSQGKIGYEKCV